MKIIDQTPFFNEKGEISTADRLKAFVQYGKSWLAEMDAQRAVLPVLDKILDRKFTLLRNIKPPELDAPIPFILIGPPGIFVIYITPILGMFRAKGDQWGTIRGNTFVTEKVNLLARTERMARAVQVNIQRQGKLELVMVEPILLCSNPGVHVDSLRPIVRIVMRDALERFAVSLSQARLVLSPEMVFKVVTLLTEPPTSKEEVPAIPAEAQAEPLGQPFLEEGIPGNTPAFVPESTADTPWTPNSSESIPFEAPESISPASPSPEPVPQAAPSRRKGGISRTQWLFLGLMALIWIILVMVFIFLVLKDLN